MTKIVSPVYLFTRSITAPDVPNKCSGGTEAALDDLLDRVVALETVQELNHVQISRRPSDSSLGRLEIDPSARLDWHAIAQRSVGAISLSLASESRAIRGGGNGESASGAAPLRVAAAAAENGV
eukprot:TRINITY_DN22322_c0_g1_i1.p1 TRINITY_DN22322_c0_g1~~TRINITY_DN22322_c0_g1_i1.p1  ORF type:complete len:124 (+),score=16.79 TRINITY_DN22322_c0_g1_i1:255-626(+)